MIPAPLCVLLCCHDSRSDYLSRTLDALRAQTLPQANWELIVCDNASHPPLDPTLAAWHPQGRSIQVPELGKSHALLAAFAETASELIVIVDDDNLLAPDYLARALALSRDWPTLGVWGGSVSGEFAVPPLPASVPYLHYLAIRETETDVWARLPGLNDAIPYGAGMCLRRDVFDKYAGALQSDPRRAGLDPVGKKLLRAGDLDLALTAHDCGLGAARFSELKLTHLIPAERLAEAYLVELIQTAEYSAALLRHFRGVADRPLTKFDRTLLRLKLLRMNPQTRPYATAQLEGRIEGERA